MEARLSLSVGLLDPNRKDKKDNVCSEILNFTKKESDDVAMMLFMKYLSGDTGFNVSLVYEKAPIFLAELNSRGKYLRSKMKSVKVKLLKGERCLDVALECAEETRPDFVETKNALIKEGWTLEENENV